MTDHDDQPDAHTPAASSRANTADGLMTGRDHANGSASRVLGGTDQPAPGDDVMGGANQPPQGDDAMGGAKATPERRRHWRRNRPPQSDDAMGGANQPPQGSDVMAPHGGDDQPESP